MFLKTLFCSLFWMSLAFAGPFQPGMSSTQNGPFQSQAVDSNALQLDGTTVPTATIDWNAKALTRVSRFTLGASTLFNTSPVGDAPGLSWMGDSNEVIGVFGSTDFGGLGGVLWWQRDTDSNQVAGFINPLASQLRPEDDTHDVFYFYTYLDGPLRRLIRPIKFGFDLSLTLAWEDELNVPYPNNVGGEIRNIQNFEFTEQAAAPTTPLTDKHNIYYKSDGEPYTSDDADVERAILIAGQDISVGSVTTSKFFKAAQATTSLTGDDQVVDVAAVGYTQLSSDDGTPANRTFVLNQGDSAGHKLTLEWVGTNAGELLDDSAADGGGNHRLAGDWAGTQYDTLTLHWNGTDWIEDGRSVN